MDGTRDRPPGKTAENWSRRDGIRAGSVSGPWRSAPRAAAGTPVAAPRRPTMDPVLGAPAPAVAYRLERRGRSFGVWIGVGVLVGAGLVAAAVFLRPETPAAVPVETAAAVAEAPQVAEVEEEVAPANDPSLAGVGVVRLRVGPEFSAERQAAILAALRGAGITGVRVEALPFRIATSRVGYYRSDDLAAAEALGRLVTPVLSESIGVRDYGKLLADPEPGRLDLWVGS